jgi:hypothetical protein
VLMLIEGGDLLNGVRTPALKKLLALINRSTRDTDLKGWYKNGSVIGVIFTELGTARDNTIVQALSNKLTDSLYDNLSMPDFNQIRLSFQLFPEEREEVGPGSLVQAASGY